MAQSRFRNRDGPVFAAYLLPICCLPSAQPFNPAVLDDWNDRVQLIRLLTWN
jgi:hypothetical protein